MPKTTIISYPCENSFWSYVNHVNERNVDFSTMHSINIFQYKGKRRIEQELTKLNLGGRKLLKRLSREVPIKASKNVTESLQQTFSYWLQKSWNIYGQHEFFCLMGNLLVVFFSVLNIIVQDYLAPKCGRLQFKQRTLDTHGTWLKASTHLYHNTRVPCNKTSVTSYPFPPLYHFQVFFNDFLVFSKLEL